MKDNTQNSSPVNNLSLTKDEIDKILSMTLIAKLATLDYEGGIHIVPMWFIRIGNEICIPTSRRTRKYKNLVVRPYASVMIDISHEGLNLRGVLIKGNADIVEGQDADKINNSIHLKYVKPEGLSNSSVVSYLSKGDDITIKIHMDKLVSWNLANSDAGIALLKGGWSRPLDA